ncbi:MAG: (d)CMP kinase [Alphaproteobacteria bacterium]|nr:(d)CMP kinase [Alphaproteobacteria bacterium]PHX98748.1 MAG: cytidylate kinase [Rhodospirillaceae bacterium]
MSGSIIVAIDGSAASGKGTLAKRIAAHFDFAYLDSGSLYRAIGVAVLRKSGDPTNEAQAVSAAKNLDITQFTPEDLRTEAAGVAASQVAAIPAVRAAILQFQRDFAHTPPHGKKGAVLDGRDIGTVVCPHAPAKIFVSASLDVRVARRIKELRAKGELVIEARVRADLEARDVRDSSRAVAPMKPAEDAWQLDTSALDADQVFDLSKNFVAEKIAKAAV